MVASKTMDNLTKAVEPVHKVVVTLSCLADRSFGHCQDRRGSGHHVGPHPILCKQMMVI